jgi:peroxiredoxin Q/BCP
LRRLFGVPTTLFGLLPGRVTYVFDAKGYCIYIFDSLSAKNHIERALKAIRKVK